MQSLCAVPLLKKRLGATCLRVNLDSYLHPTVGLQVGHTSTVMKLCKTSKDSSFASCAVETNLNTILLPNCGKM